MNNLFEQTCDNCLKVIRQNLETNYCEDCKKISVICYICKEIVNEMEEGYNKCEECDNGLCDFHTENENICNDCEKVYCPNCKEKIDICRICENNFCKYHMEKYTCKTNGKTVFICKNCK